MDSSTQEFVKWPSVELFHNLKRGLDAKGICPTVTFRPKIKLDGTNAAVQILPDGTLIAQSRNQIITPENDNAGLARWVNENKECFANIQLSSKVTGVRIILFGEWCGQGIQKRTSVSSIGKRVFAIFGVMIGNTLETNPGTIESLIGVISTNDSIFVLPWEFEEVTIDFSNASSVKEAAEKMNAHVAAVESQDPWVSREFGVEGLGEGLVYYGTGIYSGDRHFLFKAKGEKHQVVKSKAPVEVDPEVLESIGAFVEKFVTDQRLEQGLTESANDDLSMKNIGPFLGWVSKDVLKESKAELEVSGLDWKQVNKPVTAKARQWFISKSREI